MLAGEVERLTEQRETTSARIHHGDLSKGMHPRFCPLPSYSAFQFMSLLPSPSLTAITQGGITERTDVLHMEGLSLKSESNERRGRKEPQAAGGIDYPLFYFMTLSLSHF